MKSAKQKKKTPIFSSSVPKAGAFFRPPSLAGGGGQVGVLPEGVNGKMESAFGQNFSTVKIHKDSPQASAAGALAFAQAENIHFAPGQFRPESTTGQELIGHELAHIVQQRAGRVVPTGQLSGVAVNTNKNLEQEASSSGKRAARGITSMDAILAPAATTAGERTGGVRQFVLPAIVAAIGASEWVAIGALGYVMANDATNTASGDIGYSFDEMEGVILPNGGSDVAAHRTAHPNAQIFEATHKLAIWTGLRNTRKMGIKMGITFLYDTAGAIGNISCSLLDVYDWAGWGGSINVNFTPRSLASGYSSVRVTINVNEDNSWFVSDDSGSIVLTLRGGDADLSVITGTSYIHHKIG